jgi:hypothetical protein
MAAKSSTVVTRNKCIISLITVVPTPTLLLDVPAVLLQENIKYNLVVYGSTNDSFICKMEHCHLLVLQLSPSNSFSSVLYVSRYTYRNTLRVDFRARTLLAVVSHLNAKQRS